MINNVWKLFHWFFQLGNSNWSNNKRKSDKLLFHSYIIQLSLQLLSNSVRIEQQFSGRHHNVWWASHPYSTQEIHLFLSKLLFSSISLNSFAEIYKMLSTIKVLIGLTLLNSVLSVEVCGRSSDVLRIIGGNETKVLEYPWMAYLKITHVIQGSHNISHVIKCDASLIDDQWLISAAHCFQKKVNSTLTSVHVKLGAHNVTKHETTQIDQVTKNVSFGGLLRVCSWLVSTNILLVFRPSLVWE